MGDKRFVDWIDRNSVDNPLRAADLVVDVSQLLRRHVVFIVRVEYVEKW